MASPVPCYLHQFSGWSWTVSYVPGLRVSFLVSMETVVKPWILHQNLIVSSETNDLVHFKIGEKRQKNTRGQIYIQVIMYPNIFLTLNVVNSSDGIVLKEIKDLKQ